MAGFDFDTLKNVPLERQVELLTDRIIELESQLGLLSNGELQMYFSVHLTSLESQFVMQLIKHKDRILTKEAIFFALYGERPECDQPISKVMDVVVSKVRHKFAPHNITIKTIWGRGWMIDEANYLRLQQLRTIPLSEHSVLLPSNASIELPRIAVG